ncbi:MAG: FAD/NAD(P)-binding oxidoreductase [Bilophila wadsworthia]
MGGANNLEDADALRKACASGSVQNAVVIGAGFIGMEIAVALADMWDIKTSVVEFMPQAMPGVMSASLSDMVRHDLEEHNVDVYTGEKVQRLEGENGVVARVVTDKRTLDADLVIFATGFAPNTALARAAGLDLEERTGAILVNEYMQTSDPDIYAGGDCVAIRTSSPASPSCWRSAPSPTGRAASSAPTPPATMARRPPSTAPWARGA